MATLHPVQDSPIRPDAPLYHIKKIIPKPNGNASDVDIIDYHLTKTTMRKLKNIHPGEVLVS